MRGIFKRIEMKRILIAAASSVALAQFPVLAQLNTSIPMSVRPMPIFNQLDSYQQIQNIRAARAIADAEEARLDQEQAERRAIERREEADKKGKDNLRESLIAAINKRVNLYQDFSEVAMATNVPISTDMVRIMAVSDYAADIAYYLGKNRIESLAISNMTFTEAAKALASIEKKFK